MEVYISWTVFLMVNLINRPTSSISAPSRNQNHNVEQRIFVNSVVGGVNWTRVRGTREV